MTATLYAYPGCSTCRSARRWLDERKIPYRLVDIAREPPSIDELRRIRTAADVPVRALFNTSGQSYRAGGFAVRLPIMDEATALAELARDGMLIRRPLLVSGSVALVGFRPDAYAAALAGAADV